MKPILQALMAASETFPDMKPDTETKTLHLIVELTGIADKLLDRVTELERKTERLEQVVDRLREFAPSVGMEETLLERKEAYDG